MAFDVGAVVGRLEFDKKSWEQSVEILRKEQKSLTEEFTKSFKPADGFIGLLDKYGIMTAPEAKKATEQLEKEIDYLDEAYKTGAISLAGYQKATDEAKRKLKELGEIAEGAKKKAGFADFVTQHEQQIRSLGRTLTVGGAAITGFFGLMIKGSADAGDYINDLSKRTGIGTETLSAYKLAADKTGTSLEGIAVGMKNLANEMSSANDGGKESIRLFDELGVSYVDSTGKLRPLDEVMLDVADKFAAMPDGAEKSNLAWKVFGKTGTELIPLLNMGRKGLEENAEAMRRLGTWSAEGARKADEFNDSLIELKTGLAGTRNEIAATLLPSVKSLNQTLTNIVVKIRVWAAEHPGLTGWLSKTGLGIGLLMTHVGPLLIALPRVVKGFQTLKELDIAGKLKSINLAFLGIVGAILAAGAAVDWLINKYKAHLDAEMETFVKSMGPVREAFLMRRELIKAQVVTQEEWREIFEKSGRDYGTMLKMISTDPAYAKLKAEWDEIKKSLSSVDKATLGVTDIFKQFGLKTRTELTKELVDARAALDELRKSGEATPGAIKMLEDKVKDLTDKLHGVTTAQKTFGEVMKEWGILPIKEKESRISALLGYEAKLSEWLKANKIDLTEWGKGVRKVNEELQSLGSQGLNRVLPVARDFQDLISKAPAQFQDAAYKAWIFEGALKDIADQAMVSEATVLRFLWNVRADFLSTIGIMIPKWEDFSDAAEGFGKTTQSIMQEVSTVISDSMRNIATTIIESFGVFDFLKFKAKEFDDAAFVKAQADTKTLYDQKLATVNAEYEANRAAIMANITDEKMREDALTALDEARKAQIEQLDNWKKSETDKLLADENTKRDEFAKKEEERQNSLWTKVKGIIGTAADEMLTIFITRFLNKIADKILGTLTDTMTEAAKTVGNAVSGVTKGATAAISGLWTGLGAAVGSFLGTFLGGLGGPSGHAQQQAINDTKATAINAQQIRNWLFSAGSGFGGASYEFITGHIGDWLGWIKDAVNNAGNRIWDQLEGIKGILANLPGGQRGLVMSSPGLVMTHGTPAAPEVIAPMPELRRILAAIGPSEVPGRRGPNVINLKNEVHLDGIIITDREYARSRLIPEIINALDSNYLKSEFQEKLGIA